MIKEEIIEKILHFREARDWKQFHTPKNLSESIVIEASELLEVYQWVDSSDSKQLSIVKKDKIEDEIADIMIYILYLCNDLGIDLDDAIVNKIQKNDDRYPQDKSKGNSKKYTELK